LSELLLFSVFEPSVVVVVVVVIVVQLDTKFCEIHKLFKALYSQSKIRIWKLGRL